MLHTYVSFLSVKERGLVFLMFLKRPSRFISVDFTWLCTGYGWYV